MIPMQKSDGGWGLTWSWEERDPAAWRMAKEKAARYRNFGKSENIGSLSPHRAIMATLLRLHGRIRMNLISI
jgi:hypothetical protein